MWSGRGRLLVIGRRRAVPIGKSTRGPALRGPGHPSMLFEGSTGLTVQVKSHLRVATLPKLG